MPTLHIMSQLSGDTRYTWTTNDDDAIAKARAEFERARRNGMLAYRTDTVPAEMMLDFDPQAERIVMSPPLAGG